MNHRHQITYIKEKLNPWSPWLLFAHFEYACFWLFLKKCNSSSIRNYSSQVLVTNIYFLVIILYRSNFFILLLFQCSGALWSSLPILSNPPLFFCLWKNQSLFTSWHPTTIKMWKFQPQVEDCNACCALSHCRVQLNWRFFW